MQLQVQLQDGETEKEKRRGIIIVKNPRFFNCKGKLQGKCGRTASC